MKIRSLILAALVLVLLSGTLYWSEHRKPAAGSPKIPSDAPPAILKLNQAAIVKLDLRKKDVPPIVLAKNNSGSWQITEPRLLNADQSAVTSTLSTLSTLASERLIEDKASDLKQYGLDQPALQVDISESDNKSQRLLVGDDTPAGSAFYAMLGGDPRVFTVARYHKNSLDKTVNDLRDKRLLTVSPDKVSRLELIRSHQTIEFGRNKDEWQILKPRPLRAESAVVGELVGKLADARMDLSGSEKDLQEAASAFAHATPVATARVSDEAGSQELQIRQSQGRYYAKSSALDGAYKVDSSLGQALDKGLDQFRNGKLFDFGFDDPNKIEMHNGTKAYLLSRVGMDWWSNGKKMDAASLQDFVSDLRELTASKFPDSGFSKPTIELTITSEDGKLIENVLISKAGDAYIAKRENDPTLYQLGAHSVDALEKAAEQIKPSALPGK